MAPTSFRCPASSSTSRSSHSSNVRSNRCPTMARTSSMIPCSLESLRRHVEVGIVVVPKPRAMDVLAGARNQHAGPRPSEATPRRLETGRPNRQTTCCQGCACRRATIESSHPSIHFIESLVTCHSRQSLLLAEVGDDLLHSLHVPLKRLYGSLEGLEHLRQLARHTLTGTHECVQLGGNQQPSEQLHRRTVFSKTTGVCLRLAWIIVKRYTQLRVSSRYSSSITHDSCRMF